MGAKYELMNYNLSDYDHEFETHCSISVILEKLLVAIDWRLDINQDYLDDDADENARQGYAFDESIGFDRLDQLQRFVHHMLTSLYGDCFNLFISGGPPVDDVEDILVDFEALAMKKNTPLTIKDNKYRNKVAIEDIEKTYGPRLPKDFKDFLTSDAWKPYEQYEAADLPGDRIGGKHLGNEKPVLLQFMDQSLLRHKALFLKEGLCPIGKFIGQGLGIYHYGLLQVKDNGTVYITAKHENFRIAKSYHEFINILEKPTKIVPLW